MQIHLKEADLKTAVKDFIKKMGVSRPVDEIDFTATRGADGVLTTVELLTDTVSAQSIGDIISAALDESPASPDVVVELHKAPVTDNLLQDIADDFATESIDFDNEDSDKSLFS